MTCGRGHALTLSFARAHTQLVQDGQTACKGKTANMTCTLLARLGVSAPVPGHTQHLHMAAMFRGEAGPHSGAAAPTHGHDAGAQGASGGHAKPTAVGSCSKERRVPAAQRRVCGWAGVTAEHCVALGCCWFGPQDGGSSTGPGVGGDQGPGGESPYCAQRTYRDVENATFHLLSCNGSATASWDALWEWSTLTTTAVAGVAYSHVAAGGGGGGVDGGCAGHLGVGDRDSFQPGWTLRRVGEFPAAGAFKPSPPPPPLTTTELIVEVLSEQDRVVHRNANGHGRLADLVPSLTHMKSLLTASIFEVTASARPAGAAAGGIPPAVYDLNIGGAGGVARATGGFFPGDVTYREAAEGGDGIRVMWEMAAAPAHVGEYVQCFQGKKVLECVDDLPAAGWRDPVTLANCSVYNSSGWCRGHVPSILGPVTSPPAGPQGGQPSLQPVDDSDRAHRVCCACGGGRTKVIYTQVKCVSVRVEEDTAPQLLVSAQVAALTPQPSAQS